MKQAPARILAVDDEPDVEPLIRQGLKKEIQSGDYELAFAGDGVEALEMLESDLSVDLVLTDLYMPRMDGLTLLERVQEMDRLLKAVVVSAYGDLDNIRTAMNRGAFDFLMKPLLLDDLRTTVRKAVHAIDQQRQAELVRKTFGRYLSAEVARSLLSQPGGLKLGGEKRRVSLLMSDLRGFSTISETLGPDTVVDMLNIYLGRMADVIAEYGGTIIEYIGDAIFVVFGAPVAHDDHALRAVACATAMQLAMSDVNAHMHDMGIRDLEMGIGIHTGEVVIGSIGSERRAKYGAVGSHVNLVGRIESWTVGGQIFASTATLEEAGEAVLTGRESTLVAKGFSKPVQLFEVRGVGDPYGLALPSDEESLVHLKVPVPCSFVLIDGKAVTDQSHHGEIVRLSTGAAVVRSSDPPDAMSNIRMRLALADVSQSDIYAKIVSTVSDRGLLTLRFTAVPEDVSAVMDRLCSTRNGTGEEPESA